MKKILLIAWLLVYYTTFLYSQVKVLDFPQFQKRLQNSKDTVLVVNFWTTWCKECVAEMPNFIKMNKVFQSEKIKLIFVSLDTKHQLKKVISFVKRKKIKQEVIVLDAQDGNKWIDLINPKWSGAIPTTLIVNKKGNYVAFHTGSLDYEALLTLVNPYL